MKVYQKPSIVADLDKNGVIPVLISLTGAAVAAALSKGKTVIDSNHTQILNAHQKK